jgi:hypothetical protein
MQSDPETIPVPDGTPIGEFGESKTFRFDISLRFNCSSGGTSLAMALYRSNPDGITIAIYLLYQTAERNEKWIKHNSNVNAECLVNSGASQQAKSLAS